MLFTKLKAMSVGPLWVLRSNAETQSSIAPGSVTVVLADPIIDEVQQKLLENCLFAAGWDIQANYFYLTNSSKKLTEHIAMHAPKCVVAFGHSAVQLMNPEFVAGQIHHYENVPLVATYHPEEMVIRPNLKAQVWADLCLLKDVVGGFEDVDRTTSPPL